MESGFNDEDGGVERVENDGSTENDGNGENAENDENT
jgi:hypothetical protein